MTTTESKTTKQTKALLRIPETIINDTLNYRAKLEEFLAGQSSALAFRASRVPMGIYEQRTIGAFMIRIRIGAGLVLPVQLNRIAELSKKYGNSVLHITTRQDIQIHGVNIEDTPDILESLLEVGLSSRGGGGNTVRNVTACPKAGACDKENFDVTPYAIAVTEYLLQDKASFNLPRKYKLAFSGCSKDCAFASVADLGFFAHKKDDTKGFAVYAAGGLGSDPAVAVKIEDFIKADDIFVVAEAIKKLFDKHGDRTNKHKARLRYVLARMGTEKFLNTYRRERDILRTEGLAFEIPDIRDISSDYPVPKGTAIVKLWLKNGDIPADDMQKVGQIANHYGQGLVRTTQLQNLLIAGVAPENINKVNNELKKLHINVFNNGKPKIVTCAGAATCKLGLCLSRAMANAISERLSTTHLSEEVIRISGCPNSCGQHHISDIGLQGKAKRINGRLMPFYDILVDAKIVEGNARLAQKIATVPAKIIPDLLLEAVNNGKVNKSLLTKLITQYSTITKSSFPDDYYYDWEAEEPFSLAGRGPGECGAGVMDVIKLDIDEAKDAIKIKPVSDESIYKAIIAAARSLLVTFGLEPKKDREIIAAFNQYIIIPGWVNLQLQSLLESALDWKLGDLDSIQNLLPRVENLISRVEKLFCSLNANLEFTIEPAVQKTKDKTDKIKNHTIDLRNIACPLNFVKAKLKLEKLKIGDILEILLDEGEPVRNVPATFAEQGQNVLDVKNVGEYYCVKVQRTK